MINFKYIKTKLSIVLGSLTGLIAIMGFLSVPFLRFINFIFGLEASNYLVVIILFISSVIAFSLIYLQSGNSEQDNIEYLINKFFKRKSDQDNIRFSSIENKIVDLERELTIRYINGEISNDDKQKIINDLIDNVRPEVIGEIFNKQALEYKEKLVQQLSVERFSNLSKEMVSRLLREIYDLRLRSNVNLVIGMLITGGGLVLLWSTVDMVDTSELLKQFASEGSEANSKFMKSLMLPILPRLLLIIFIEVFAYFFLRLYRDGLLEIKYFQNELTNLESKLAAVEFSYLVDCQDSLKLSLNSLSNTERNFVLKRGETTVELERAKSESELTKNILKAIPVLFNQKGKS